MWAEDQNQDHNQNLIFFCSFMKFFFFPFRILIKKNSNLQSKIHSV